MICSQHQVALLCRSQPTPTLCPALQVWSQAPVGLGGIVLYWVCLYIATGFQESKLHVE